MNRRRDFSQLSRNQLTRHPKRTRERALHFEHLENRTVLSAAAPIDSSELHLEVENVTLVINGQEVVLDDSESHVRVANGDTVSLKAVDYAIEDLMLPTESAVAAEAYFRKSDAFDYGDGRFGDTRGKCNAADATEITLQGNWEVGSDWNRMSIPLLFYNGDDAQVHDRFFINFEVVRSIQDRLQSVHDRLRDAFDNKPSVVVDNMARALMEVREDVAELTKAIPNPRSALWNLDGVVSDLEKAVEGKRIGKGIGRDFMSRLAAISRQVAIELRDGTTSRKPEASSVVSLDEIVPCLDEPTPADDQPLP